MRENAGLNEKKLGCLTVRMPNLYNRTNPYAYGDAMAVGFVLISTAPGKEHEIFQELQKIVEITELNPLFGEYDLIAKVEVEELDMLGLVVIEKIRKVKGVMDTKTLTGIKF
jgi:DNA-binding Lrp family transcriptional regulator